VLHALCMNCLLFEAAAVCAECAQCWRLNMAEMVLAVCKLIGRNRYFVNIVYSHVRNQYSEVLIIHFQNTLRCVPVEMFELYHAPINPSKPSGHYMYHQF